MPRERNGQECPCYFLYQLALAQVPVVTAQTIEMDYPLQVSEYGWHGYCHQKLRPLSLLACSGCHLADASIR